MQMKNLYITSNLKQQMDKRLDESVNLILANRTYLITKKGFTQIVCFFDANIMQRI